MTKKEPVNIVMVAGIGACLDRALEGKWEAGTITLANAIGNDVPVIIVSSTILYSLIIATDMPENIPLYFRLKRATSANEIDRIITMRREQKRYAARDIIGKI